MKLAIQIYLLIWANKGVEKENKAEIHKYAIALAIIYVFLNIQPFTYPFVRRGREYLNERDKHQKVQSLRLE